MKELESRGDKAGVVMNTIKDTVQALVDDRRVHQDKIGAGSFFWAFPASAYIEVCMNIYV